MSQAKGGNGKVVQDDLLDDIEDSEPIARKAGGGRSSVPFVPVPAVMERVSAALNRTGAFGSKTDFPTYAEAYNRANQFLRYALEVAGAMEPAKSAGIRITDSTGALIASAKVANATGQAPFHASVQLTHRRTAKDEAEAEAEAEATAEATA